MFPLEVVGRKHYRNLEEIGTQACILDKTSERKYHRFTLHTVALKNADGTDHGHYRSED